ncbi:Crp/Fnr family transcriptional regulator [Cedecea neteri]|nr:Crp/Fnr family transcriptional regulator [Cedecea neteri]
MTLLSCVAALPESDNTMNIIQQFAQRGHQILRDAVYAAPLKSKEIGPDEFILRQGEEIKALYWITLGEYTMHYNAENGKAFSLGQRFVSDTIIGEIEYLTHTPSQFSVVAHDSMTVKVIPLAMMDTILTSHAEVGVWLSQLLSTSYQRGMARTMERFLQPLVFNIVADLYERHQQNKPLVDFSQVSREAERFGCSERTYRRVINQLIEEHYIQKVAHEFVICDIEKFRQVLTHPGRIA